jgi:prepilin-type N-terminal cleavage/methylation domain-containing protein
MKLMSEKGFTLIEVLITIVILSFLMISVFSIIDNSTITKENITIEDRELLQIESALTRFELDFTQLYSPLFYAKKFDSKNYLDQNKSSTLSKNQITSLSDYQPSELFPLITETNHPIPAIINDNMTDIMFMTSNNKRKFENAKQSNYAWVRYFLEEDESSLKTLKRQFIATNIYSGEFEDQTTKAHTLATNIKSLSFLYWDQEKSKFAESLKYVDYSTTPLKLIKIILVWVDKNEVEHEIIRTYRSLWPYFNPNKINLGNPYSTEDTEYIEEEDDE